MKIIDIIREDAARGGYTVEQLLAKDNTARVRKLRQYAMWRARNETKRSWTAIGFAFKRDHTTVLHGCRRIEAMKPEERLALPDRPPEAKPPTEFYVGRDCANGHGGLRYAKTNLCVGCRKLYGRRARERAKTDMDTRDGRAVGVSCCVAVE